MGETFTIDSAVLGETRRINVFVPTVYGEPIEGPMPVLYMPDGGMGEDFLHVAGLVEVLVCNEGMRPFLVVGIENTQRRRDLTGPTGVASDREIAPVVGGSAAFRRFLREELMPVVRKRYRTTAETAIVGESLAGLFIMETLFVEPDLFDTYLAIDPSLWWDDGAIVRSAEAGLDVGRLAGKRVFLANSDEPVIAGLTGELVEVFARAGVAYHYAPMPQETHATIYQPAALRGFREALGGEPAGGG
ncbi:MAG: alpha/beta hydrolase [Phycisphaerales bacterium]|nr:alpha/beta hydrolase [Phycisphaerales bacterium]